VNISVVDPYFSTDPDLYNWLTDPDPALVVIGCPDANKKQVLFLKYFSLSHFKATFTTAFKEKKPQNSTYKQ
jgi:hypothetical protein